MGLVYAIVFLLISMGIGGVIGLERPALAQSSLGGPNPGDPSSRRFGMTDPAATSLGATQQLGDQFRAQQHRFQPNADRRQLRTKRPEPGEAEVNRDGEMLHPETARKWRFRQPESTLPEKPHRAPYTPSTLPLPGSPTPNR